MNNLNKLVFTAAVMLFAGSIANAELVHGSTRKSGTSAAPCNRTHANGRPCDNLGYGEYPSRHLDCLSPRLMPSLDTDCYEPELIGVKTACLRSPQISGSSIQFGDISFHAFSTSRGMNISGTSIAIGDIVFHDVFTSAVDIISRETITIGNEASTTLDEW